MSKWWSVFSNWNFKSYFQKKNLKNRKNIRKELPAIEFFSEFLNEEFLINILAILISKDSILISLNFLKFENIAISCIALSLLFILPKIEKNLEKNYWRNISKNIFEQQKTYIKEYLVKTASVLLNFPLKALWYLSKKLIIFSQISL